MNEESDLVCEGVANGKLHPVSLKPYPRKESCRKATETLDTNTTTNNNNNNSNNRMTMNNYFTNRKDEGGAMIWTAAPASAAICYYFQRAENATKQADCALNFFANALKDDEEERNRREALKRYAAKPSTFDAFEYSNNNALLPMNRATPELSLQSPMKKRVVKSLTCTAHGPRILRRIRRRRV